MDTGTHIVMGIALGGLATLDPVVSNDPLMFNSVLVGTIIGSQAPDFDTILKLKNNATYIRNHRGITHSIPAIIIWGILIPLIIYLFVLEVNFLHLWLWTFLAVFLHVFVDVFNAYGTQAFRPFSHKWVAYGFINTFDTYIFFAHIAGIVAWTLGAKPGPTFLINYVIIIFYYIKRFFFKKEIVKTIKQHELRVSVSTTDRYYVGTVVHGHIQLYDEFERVPVPNIKLMDKAKQDKNISAFLSFSPIYRWEITEYENYDEVRFTDLR